MSAKTCNISETVQVAYINVPLSTYCKIRYVSKFTAASRGSTCDGTAFLSHKFTVYSKK